VVEALGAAAGREAAAAEGNDRARGRPDEDVEEAVEAGERHATAVRRRAGHGEERIAAERLIVGDDREARRGRGREGREENRAGHANRVGVGRADAAVEEEVRRAEAADREHLRQLVVVGADQGEVEDRAARRAELGRDRRLVSGPYGSGEIRLDADVVDDGLDDAVADVPVADAAVGVRAAEQERGVAGADLLRRGKRGLYVQQERPEYEAESLGPVHRRSSLGRRAHAGPNAEGAPTVVVTFIPLDRHGMPDARIARKIYGVRHAGCATPHACLDTNVSSWLLTNH
jgi:hypothetical protein